MDYSVPLHALVVVISTHPHDRLDDVEAAFPEHEIISMNSIRWDLWGPDIRPELAPILHTEMRHRLALKLSLGERVVVHGSNMRTETRMALAATAQEQGAFVIYLLADPNDLRIRSDPGIMGGDGVADAVISLGKQALDPVLPLPENPMEDLRSRFRGVTVVGDVHGNVEGLKAAADWAKSRDHFLWLLGDVIDYGAGTLAALDEVHRLIMFGQAAMVVGNHERKIARWFQEHRSPLNNIRLSDGNKVTIEALGRMTTARQMQWFGKLRSVLARSSLVTHLGNLTLAHAALHPDIWCRDPDNQHGIEHFALYGEAPPTVAGSPYRNSYDWVDSVPDGVLAMVGHDKRAGLPMMIKGAKGGQVVFLDTGSGKTGSLSSADLRFDPDGNLRLECFNQHD